VPDKPASKPDLASLREGWISHEAALRPIAKKTPMPSIPTASQEISNTSPKKKVELPELASMASQTVFSMEGLDAVLASAYPDKVNTTPTTKASDEQSPEPVKLSTTPLPTQPTQSTSAALPAQSKLSTLELPTLGKASGNQQSPPTRSQSSLAAMPSSAAPNVSLPLVRDQLITPAQSAPATPAPKAATPQPKPPVVSMPTPPAKDAEAKPAAKADPVPAIPSASKRPVPRQSELPLVPERKATPAIEKVDSPPPFAEVPRTAEPSRVTASTPQPQPKSDRPDYTDADLSDALRPIIDYSVDKFLYTPSHGIHTYLEPMLRSTVRRAIAEQMDDSSPFNEVAGWDKLAWKMRALFSSRTYEDIVFDRTKRYQVEEVFLLRRHTRSMISYASNSPVRHSQTGKVQSTVKKIASKCGGSKDPSESENYIKWEDNRSLMIRRGKHCILAAIVHGSSNAILRSDLDYALRQAEERFGKALEEENDIHLQILQPLLEGCLLIKAPSIPN